MLYAIVIGIDEYKDPNISNLSHACDDARAIAERIELNIHQEDCKVTLLLNEEATKSNIEKEIVEILPRVAQSEDDTVIVFFAGHGSPEASGAPDEFSRYLVAYDTQYSYICTTGIDMVKGVNDWFQRLRKPKLVLFFFDACFSGLAGGRTFEGPTLHQLGAGYRQVARESIKTRLQDIELGSGRAIITACDDDQLAFEIKQLGHGIFTHEFLSVLSAPGEEKTVSVSHLYENIRRNVITRSNGKQNPVLNGRIVGAQLPRMIITS